MSTTSLIKPRCEAGIHPVSTSLEDMTPSQAMASLSARVQTGRVHEHHLWEAVRILTQVGQLPEDFKHSAEFRTLMDRDALREALFLLIQMSKPARRVDCLNQIGGDWVCILTFADSSDVLCKASHAHQLAAVLTALLGSVRQSMAASDTRGGDVDA